MPDNLLERIQKTVGVDVLPDVAGLDRRNDLHVDKVAAALHRHFLASDDVEAWKLLCDLTEERLRGLAREVIRELGLLEDPDELVVRFFESLFVDVRPRGVATESFLKSARNAMSADAESWVRDIALSSADDPESPAVWEDGHRQIPDADRHQRATRICFHRLDQPYRRALRAKDVDNLTHEEIASRLTLTTHEVEELLSEATLRLTEAIERELDGGRP